jgi:hypothetical protein
MSALKTARPRPQAVATPAPLVVSAPEAAPAVTYRPDSWALWFWLACAGVLLLLHVIDWIGSAFDALFRR